MTAQKLDGTATAKAIKARAHRAGGQAARARASRPGWARCWSATTRARRGTSTASTRTAPRSASSRSARTCRAPRRRTRSWPPYAASTTTPPAPATSCSCRCRRASTRTPCSARSTRTKDADGLHPTNLGWLVLGKAAPLPCTPFGIVTLLRRHGVEINGADVVVVGRGVTVGRPLGPAADPPLRERHGHAVPHRHPRPRRARAPGRHRGGRGRRARHHHRRHGQARRRRARRRRLPRRRQARRRRRTPSVYDVAGWVSPNPGGVGPMTRAMLLSNVVERAEASTPARPRGEPHLVSVPEEPRRIPSTLGGLVYLIVVAVTAVGLLVVAFGPWRRGVAHDRPRAARRCADARAPAGPQRRDAPGTPQPVGRRTHARRGRHRPARAGQRDPEPAGLTGRLRFRSGRAR